MFQRWLELFWIFANNLARSIPARFSARLIRRPIKLLRQPSTHPRYRNYFPNRVVSTSSRQACQFLTSGPSPAVNSELRLHRTGNNTR
ncbi:unnamed protein product, partial [Nesidiocoris tenuis]